jgi:hypothetical protein
MVCPSFPVGLSDWSLFWPKMSPIGGLSALFLSFLGPLSEASHFFRRHSKKISFGAFACFISLVPKQNSSQFPCCKRSLHCSFLSFRYTAVYRAFAMLLPPPRYCCCPAAALPAALPPGVLGSARETSLGGLGSALECLGEQVSLLVRELVGGEFVPWPSQTVFGGNRNPEESGGIRCKYWNSCPRNSCKNSCESG